MRATQSLSSPDDVHDHVNDENYGDQLCHWKAPVDTEGSGEWELRGLTVDGVHDARHQDVEHEQFQITSEIAKRRGCRTNIPTHEATSEPTWIVRRRW